MRKAARTRARLQRTALSLFLERGYDATTVAEVAAAAGVSPMTFFRHFPAKESVVLEDPFDPAIAAAVAAQPRGLDPLRRVCRGLRTALSGLDLPDVEEVRDRARVVARTPSLRAGMWANTEATQRVVADALAADGVPRLRAEVAAVAALAALTVALQEWARGQDPSFVSSLLTALDVLDPEGDRR